MVQILPAAQQRQSFGQKLNIGVGRGLEAASEMMKSNQQSEAIKKTFGDEIANLPPELQKLYAQELFKSQFAPTGPKPLTELQESQKALADERLKALQGQQELFSKLQGNQAPKGISESGDFLSNLGEGDLDQLSAFAGQPGEMGIIGNFAKGEKEKRKEENKKRTEKEKQYFKFNEPKLAQLADTERKLELENARYERLGELFSDPSKFPSSLTAALFSKEGQINDIVYSQLTPEAQESIKLIIDSTSNIKDTYGARVTNFDLQTYLKKLPSLLNSAEGKKRVLRDLQIMNQLNQLHAQGIQEIFDEKGGSDKIPYSTAENLYKKRYGEMEKQMIDKFVHPEKGKFNELPDPNKYLGRKIKNPETGEIFISDGNEWKLFEG